METKEEHQTFINELLLKQNEMLSKLTGYFSTLGDQQHKQNKCNYTDIYRKLSLYEHKITSLNTQLEQLKKENILIHIHQTFNKEILSIKEYTQEFKELISNIKEEVHEIKKTLLPYSIQGLEHEIHVEKLHTDTIQCLMELKDKRIATCSNDQSIYIISLNY